MTKVKSRHKNLTPKILSLINNMLERNQILSLIGYKK